MKAQEYKLNESYGFFFNMIHVSIKEKLEVQLKQFDITAHQFGILLIIFKKKSLTQREIVKFTTGDEPSTTRLITRLEDKGLLVRVTDKNDKRKRLVSLTQQAESLLEKILPYAQEGNKQLVSSLNDEEKRTLLNLLRKVASSL
ncbi:MAG: MarR family transcriptional regulator [Campylobacterota bacterium]|nr:MarR family transcriptional regulator [Campylobacterota bacterium]